jgi:flagellar basal body-associated protein FliL
MSKRSIILCVLVVVVFLGAIASVVFDFKPKAKPEDETEPEVKLRVVKKPDVKPVPGATTVIIPEVKTPDNGGK